MYCVRIKGISKKNLISIAEVNFLNLIKSNFRTEKNNLNFESENVCNCYSKGIVFLTKQFPIKYYKKLIVQFN